MKEVFWTPLALNSLEQTEKFIRKVWNQKVVDEFYDLLDFRINQIQKNPNLAPNKYKKVQQLFIHRNVSLFYVNYPFQIRILLIWDNRQDSKQLLNILKEANN